MDGARPITHVISDDLYEGADHWTGAAQQETGDKVGYTNEKETFGAMRADKSVTG